MLSWSSSFVRSVAPDNVYFANENDTTYRHSDGNDRKIDASKVETSDVDMFSGEDVPP